MKIQASLQLFGSASRGGRSWAFASVVASLGLTSLAHADLRTIATLNSLSTPTQCQMPYATVHNATMTATGSGANVSFQAPSANPFIQLWNVNHQDFSSAGAAAVDVSNPTSSYQTFFFKLTDANGNAIQNSFVIAPGQSTSIALFLNGSPVTSSYGMDKLPPVYQGFISEAADNTTASVSLSNITTVMVFPDGGSATPASQLTFSNVRLLAPINWASVMTGLIDPYGQSTLTSWATKLTDPSQFGTRRSAEESSFNSGPLAGQVDQYGGATGLPKQTATGHYRAAKVNGKWWLVSPAGTLFFMNGVDSANPYWYATRVDGSRSTLFSWLPGSSDPLAQNYEQGSLVQAGASGTGYDFYTSNLQRKYGTNWTPNWVNTFFNRMTTWGLNTVGVGAHQMITGATTRMPWICHAFYSGNYNTVAASANAVAPVPDAFDPNFKAAIVNMAQSYSSQWNSDPYLVGTMVDNELDWVGATGNASDPYILAINLLAQNAASSPGKTQFIHTLQTRYIRIQRLNAVWNTHYGSWADMNQPLAFGSNLTATMQRDLTQFVGTMATQYYGTVKSVLKQYAPNMMYFGSAFGFFNPQIFSAAASNCDVIALNMYTTAEAPAQVYANVQAMLNTTDVPVYVNEFNFDSLSDGLFGGFVPVADETTRAADYTSYVQTMLAHPNFVGTNYFLYSDEPTAGQIANGENFSQGLVDVTDTPYPLMVSAIQSVAKGMYLRRWNS